MESGSSPDPVQPKLMANDRDLSDKAFKILEEDLSRQDLALRREVKFLLPGADVGTLRSLMECNGRRLVHNEPVSTVRSVYFDDVQLSDCQATLDGISRRRKVRLRWYDSLDPGDVLFFEIKWRDNRVVGKHRLELRTQQPVSELTYRQVIDNLIDALPPQHVGDLLKRNEPIVIVEYKREHFESPDGRVRVTLDYDLAFYDQTGKQYLSTSFPHRLPNMFVLEAKGPQGFEEEVKELLYPFAPRMGSCSKYVHGCQQLGLVPSRNYH